jgi:hypothetical protein
MCIAPFIPPKNQLRETGIGLQRFYLSSKTVGRTESDMFKHAILVFSKH